MPDHAERSPLDLNVASEREILVEILHTIRRHNTLERHAMSNIDSAVTDLTGAVQELADRITGTIDPLKTALAAAQQALSDLTVQDDSDKAALAAALDDANTAAANIETQVQAIDALAPADAPADPGTPTDPSAPADPTDPVVTAPTDGSDPVATDPTAPADGGDTPTDPNPVSAV